MPTTKEQEKQPGVLKKSANFLGKAASAIASAAAGAAAGAALGSVVPGLGTALGGLAGAIVGALFGRTILEPVLDTIFGVDQQPPTVPAAAEKAAVIPTNQHGAHNTLEMTEKLGGAQKLASPTKSLIETPVVAPKPEPSANSKPFNTPAFFDKQVTAPSSTTPMSNPAALPTPRPPGAAAAA